MGRLAYTMPAITDLLGANGMEMISTHYIANQSEDLKFKVKVSNTAEATDSSCPEDIESKCEVHYNLRYTPLLHDTVPNQIYWD